MTPLKITAEICGAIALPNGPLALDALLAAQVALRDQLPPPRSAADCVPIDIPIEKEPGGRFYLCSFSLFEPEQHVPRYINRRAPVEQYQTIGEHKIRRVQITSGKNKSYRIPMDTMHVRGDALVWYCSGDARAIEDLLCGVVALGKKRSVGLGRVRRWTVEQCDPWDGFPVMRDGKPLRPLPADYPGLIDPPLAYRTLTMPYWRHEMEELCAVPAMV